MLTTPKICQRNHGLPNFNTWFSLFRLGPFSRIDFRLAQSFESTQSGSKGILSYCLAPGVDVCISRNCEGFVASLPWAF